MITPSDSPASPSDFDAVTPTGTGSRPAPYDIQAPQADLSGTFNASTAAGLARQPETERLLASPQGYGEFSITTGSSGGGGEDWPSSVEP
jgi:hypothetical protein